MPHDRKVVLSPREKQLVNLAAEGHTDISIGHELGISEGTVGTYWARIRMKVGAYSRPELIAKLIREELDDVVHSLKEQNQKLMEQIELSAALSHEDASMACCAQLVLEAHEAIVVINDQGEIELVNERFASLFGYRVDELRNESIQMFVPARYQEIHLQHRDDYLKLPERKKMAEHAVSLGVRKDGTEFLIAASLSPVHNLPSWSVMCIVREISPTIPKA